MKKIYFVFIIFLLFIISLRSQENDIFWEKEQVLSTDNVGNFEIVSNNNILGVVFVEISNQFELNFKYSQDGYIWSSKIKLVDKYFSNNPLGVDFSASIDNNNDLYICYRTNRIEFSIAKLSYPYTNNKIKKITTIISNDIIYLPRLFIDSQNEIHLFFSSNKENKFIIGYKKLNIDGEILLENIIGDNLMSAINPMITESEGVLYLAFQAKDENVQAGFFYNIFLAISRSGGRNWNYKRIVTSDGENNQGPFISVVEKRAYLVWEKEDENYISHIYYKSFNPDGAVDNRSTLISAPNSESHMPSLVKLDNAVDIFWYDNKDGTFQSYQIQVIGDEVFESEALMPKAGRTISNQISIFNGAHSFFWIQSYRNRTLYHLQADTKVDPPRIIVNNFPSSRVTNDNSMFFQWARVNDISGVNGYRLLLTQNKEQEVTKREPLIFYKETSRFYTDLANGDWYFKMRSYDYAGNESKESIFAFTIDTVAPEPPVFAELPIDEDGTLNTNSPLIEWMDSNEPLKKFRYYYRLFLNESPNEVRRFSSNVDGRDFTFTVDKKLKLDSLDNGILLVGVQGYDSAGNISPTAWQQFQLNDYIPITIINYVTSKIIRTGESVFQIYGRGFEMDGDVFAIYLDKDRKEPYDYIVNEEDFNVISDRFIRQTKEMEIDDGSYYIGVHHPARGIEFYKSRLRYYGEWLFAYDTGNYFTFNRVLFLAREFNLTSLIFIVISLFWIVIFIILSQAVFRIVGERIYVKKLLLELENMKKEIPYVEYKKRREVVKKKGMGLTLKYTILILVLVVTVVSATSITLSALTLRNETINLANEMKERANLVMTNYETTMLDIYTFEKGFTEAVDTTVNTATLPDVGFAMFREENGTTFLRYGEKTNVFLKGVNIDDITDEEKESIIKGKVFTQKTEEDIKGFKEKYEGEGKEYPEFNPSKLKDNYIFVKPIIVEDEKTKNYKAEIIIGYSFEKILKLINKERLTLITTTFIVTLIAILISIVGSVFLATTTIRPISKMSKHVKVISTIDDYEKLIGTENEKIEINTRDEIGTLAAAINDMTLKLIEKAKADKQMLMGKEIQKKFIPLEPHETEYIDIYGFYEGAKGVSGDYFDYKRLDKDHYAFIICDVAGKAVPAALIMVQISTIFHSFCTNFDPRKDKLETVGIVNEINNTVAERGFTDRFAATLVIIINVKTGKAFLTNAGYTKLLIYRSSKKAAEWLQLDQNSGAAGVFPSEMLPHPYKQESVQIDKGDIIFLYTDGIEESRNGKKIKDENGVEYDEEFGQKRIKAIFDKSAGKTPKEMISILMDEEEIFRSGLEQYDDHTILAVKRK